MKKLSVITVYDSDIENSIRRIKHDFCLFDLGYLVIRTTTTVAQEILLHNMTINKDGKVYHFGILSLGLGVYQIEISLSETQTLLLN